MRTRGFFPPPGCKRCGQRPALGETLLRMGEVWLCAGCLADDAPGSDMTTKAALRSMDAEREKGQSRRAKAAGEIELSASFDRRAARQQNVAQSLSAHGQRLTRGVAAIHGEAFGRAPGYLQDTLSDPDLVSIEASEARGRMLAGNDVVALGIDVAKTAGASNTHEKLVAHQIALAHKVAMEQAQKAQNECDPAMEIKRLQISARMMAMAQQGVVTLQKLRTGGTQNVVVQHVYVADGGQAVVGVQTSCGPAVD
jgi:hypothetical protein